MKKAVVLVSVLILFVSCSTSCSVKKVEELTDGEIIAKEYNISKNNPFVYATLEQVNEILDQKTGIILFADSDYEGSKRAVSMILKEAEKQEIKNIYYYNPKTVTDKDKKKYQKLIKKLQEKLDCEDFQLMVPDIYAVKNGKVINHSNYFSKKEELSEEYLTKKQEKKIKNKYSDILGYKECTDC